MLRNSAVATELGLTEEQSAKLQELVAKSTPDFAKFQKELKELETKEEQTKFREEFSASVVKSRTIFEDNAISVLTPDQRAKRF